MKLFAAIVTYLVIGAILGAGIYEVMHGHAWLLIVGAIAYVVAFAKIGCLPSGGSH